MQLRHSVDRMAAHNGEMRHSHLRIESIFYYRYTTSEVRIRRTNGNRLGNETAIDFVDDFEMTRDDPLEQRNRPPLQGLRHQGVVSVSDGGACSFPCNGPWHLVLIHEQSHQFRDS